jgi:uncharacterized protein
LQLEKPDLYRLAEDGRTLVLRAARCGACDALTFPISPYGCTACGAPADRVREEAMTGAAQLLTFITIHQKLVPTITAPCVVGEARLANGAIQEIMLEGGEERFADDMEIVAVPVELARKDGPVIGCRFVPATEVS